MNGERSCFETMPVIYLRFCHNSVSRLRLLNGMFLKKNEGKVNLKHARNKVKGCITKTRTKFYNTESPALYGISKTDKFRF
jgi:hypothetical protein